MAKMLIFGMGYAAGHLAARLAARGWEVAGTTQDGRNGSLAFGDETAVIAALRSATHILSSVPPAHGADPVLVDSADGEPRFGRVERGCGAQGVQSGGLEPVGGVGRAGDEQHAGAGGEAGGHGGEREAGEVAPSQRLQGVLEITGIRGGHGKLRIGGIADGGFSSGPCGGG